MWRGDLRVMRAGCFLLYWEVDTPCKSLPLQPCAAVLQCRGCFVELEDEIKWLQFLVRPLLLEQWGLEVQGEVWF